MEHPYTNNLVHETSPYLLQHAHNPVDWQPWKESTLKEAQQEQKLLLISIGYAACHWCHVMERESFEDTLVAEVMNEHFINIKVDREERPDVDQIYMNAVQLMRGQGGWPLNVIALPDGRPIWGGTYFPKEQWLQNIAQIVKIYTQQPEKVRDYADNLERGLKRMDLIVPNTETADFTKDDLHAAVDPWSQLFDHEHGGLDRAPKFMMPNNYHFLFRYAYQTSDEQLMDHVDLTLTKMAYGGVYDQIGGGFARYSVDGRWHVPHFEKMLYDNAQLVSLYADAYSLTKNPLCEQVVHETLDFVARELTDTSGAFYSSLDADSLDEHGELEEGAFYVWKKEELEVLLGADLELFTDYYNINAKGLWEKGKYVLVRSGSDTEFAQCHGLSDDVLREKLQSWKQSLFNARAQRVRPRLDDKTLTSWNALMLKGYVDAYKVFGKEAYLQAALKNAHFLLDNQWRPDGGLDHSYKDGKSTINGYLEDYSAVITAFLDLYEVTMDETWLKTSKALANYCFDHFYDENSKMFFFTSNEDPSLVSRSIEHVDNVIPSSNSMFAKALFALSHHYGNKAYGETATQMLNNVRADATQYGSSYSNWLQLMLNLADDYYEVAVTGPDAKDKLAELHQYYIPNKLVAASVKGSSLPLLENRAVLDKTLIYVCVNNSCKLPVSEISLAVKQMR